MIRCKEIKYYNIFSMNMVTILIIVMTLPAFFPIGKTESTSKMSILIMAILGSMSFVITVLVSRALQILPIATFMICCSPYIILKGFYDGLGDVHIDILLIVGTIVGLLSALLIARSLRVRNVFIEKENQVALISN